MHSKLRFSEHLKTVPDILESLMSEKRLLQAAVLLVRSLKMINKPDMLEIGAVVDLRSYLNGQENVCELSFDSCVQSDFGHSSPSEKFSLTSFTHTCI